MDGISTGVFIKIVEKIFHFIGNLCAKRHKIKINACNSEANILRDVLNIKSVLLTNFGKSKPELKRLEIIFVRKNEIFSLTLWEWKNNKPLLLKPEESTTIEVSPISNYVCDNKVCDIAELWFENNFFFKLYLVSGEVLERPSLNKKIKKYYFSKKNGKIITRLYSSFDGVVHGASWKHLITIQQQNKNFIGFLRDNCLIILDEKKDSEIWHINSPIKNNVEQELKKIFDTKFQNYNFRVAPNKNLVTKIFQL